MRGKNEAGILRASLLLDREDRILEGNREAEVFLERPLEEVRKAPLREVNPPLYSALRELLAKTKKGRGVENYAMAYRLGKRLLRLNVSITPYPLEALGSTGSMVTISTLFPGAAREPRRRGTSQLSMPVAEAAADWRGFLDRLDDPAFLLDRDANLAHANEAMCRVLGHGGEEVLGRPLSFFMAHERAKKTLEYLAETVRATPWRGELEFKRPDGTLSVVAVTVCLWQEGKEVEMLGLGREVTSEARLRKERDEELRRVWSLLESTLSPLICFTPDHRVTMISSPAEDLLGVSRDKAIGATLSELFPPEAGEAVKALAEGAVAAGEERETAISLKVKRASKEMRLVVRPAFFVRGKVREFALLLQEIPEENGELDALRKEIGFLERRKEIMGMAAASATWERFLGYCLDLLEEEVGYSASAAFILQEGEATLEAFRGLEETDRRALARIGLRPGLARLCRQRSLFPVQAHGGVPREGWEEVASVLERPDVPVALFRERRWRFLLVIALKDGETTVGALALADPGAERLDEAGYGFLEALGKEMGAAIMAMRLRMAAQGAPDTNGGEGSTDRENSVEDAAREDAAGFQAPSPSPCQAGGGGDGGPGGEEHDYLKIAYRSRSEERLPDHLAAPGELGKGRAVPSPRGIDLAALARDIRDYYSRRGKARDIFLELEEDLPRVHVDRRLLQEALMCLLDNAIRFSPPGSPVILGVERWGSEIAFRVEDQGPGLPEEVIKELSRADAEERPSGSGEPRVGSLLVCRRFVRSMGGELHFKVVPGEGTVASIRIPVLPFVSEVS